MVRKVYRGMLMLGSNGEESDILFLAENGRLSSCPLAEIIENDLKMHGKFLSVHLYTSDKEVPADKVEETWLMSFYGLGDADYRMHYSDYTGYLYTDEDLKVGGHDLLEQLKSNKGKFLHMVIEFHKDKQAFEGKVENGKDS